MDYYVYSSRCFPGEPPSHIGFSYILPSTLQSSVGLLTVPITSTKHRPIGECALTLKNVRDHLPLYLRLENCRSICTQSDKIISHNDCRIAGQLTVEYVVIKPIPDYPWDMSISYVKHWEQRWSGLDVGHRGLGTSFKFETKK